ncbi:MAG: 1,4-dihydroxy-2-naphthoate octaprenyltransferase [Candidatus Thorarchaeota archaeon]|nr:1,4-dihydroxy-2-naphthoate octaprenyltransferase [Candidatus Thorarchaeota archaeon]
MAADPSGSDETMSNQGMSKQKAWLAEMRLPFLTGSIIPVVLGAAIAWGRYQAFTLDLFLLTLVAGVCLHLGANISNDYFDHTEDDSGTDDVNIEFIRPFSGGSRMIQSGYLSPREVLTGALVFFAIAGLIGLYLAFIRGIIILILGIIGACSGFFYTAPPFRLVKRGIGEVFIGLNFGILMVLGAFYVQVPIIELEPIIASLPIALLITAILYINQFPDYIADKTADKRTLVVRLGRRKASRGYAVLMLGVYLALFLGGVFDIIAWQSYIGLSSFPLAIVGIIFAFRFYDEPTKMVPANIATIQTHLLTGVFMIFGYILLGLGVHHLVVLISSLIAAGLAGILAKGLPQP